MSTAESSSQLAQEREADGDRSSSRAAQIIDAAARCFARWGYAETTVKAIADAVGLRKSMVHYYFESKAQLFQEVLAQSHERHLQRVSNKMRSADGPAVERAKAALKALWRTLRADRRFVRLSLEFWNGAARDKSLRERLHKTHRASRELISAEIDTVLGAERSKLPYSREALGALIVAVLNGLAIQEYAEPGGVDMDETFRVFVAALISGMSALQID